MGRCVQTARDLKEPGASNEKGACGNMRVITGSAKGLKLKEPQGRHTPPTTDQLKERLFNIIQFDIEGRRVLDLFAGTGQLGIECLSRGADRCTFVDLRKEAAALIRENLTWCALQERAQVIQGDYLAYLTRCGEKFDLILLDPPYGSGLLEKALESIAAIDILSENGIMVCESAVEQVLPELKSPYTRGKDYRYGQIKLTVYRRDAD